MRPKIRKLLHVAGMEQRSGLYLFDTTLRPGYVLLPKTTYPWSGLDWESVGQPELVTVIIITDCQEFLNLLMNDIST